MNQLEIVLSLARQIPTNKAYSHHEKHFYKVKKMSQTNLSLAVGV